MFNMFIVDMNGYRHPMSLGFINKVLFIGWIFLILAMVTNCIYYILHPMAPQVSPRKKLKTYLLGKLIPSERKDIGMHAKRNDLELGPVYQVSEETNPLKTYE